MGDYDLDNVNEQQEVSESDSEGVWIVLAIGGAITSTVLFVKNIFTKKALKAEREKNKLYQEVLRKHQAKINELNSEKERRAYRDRLWEKLQTEMEE